MAGVPRCAGSEKYLVCNGLDSDPQARTGRLLFGGNPHSVLEGILIAASAAGASRCIICVEGGQTTATRRVRKAIDQMMSYGIVGNNMLGSPFSVEMDVREVPSSFVSGEERPCSVSKENSPCRMAGHPIRPPTD